MPQSVHQFDQSFSLRLLGRVSTVGRVRRHVRTTEAGKIRADDGEQWSQQFGHLAPSHVRPRMTMQQQHGWSAASDAKPNCPGIDIQRSQFEALERHFVSIVVTVGGRNRRQPDRSDF